MRLRSVHAPRQPPCRGDEARRERRSRSRVRAGTVRGTLRNFFDEKGFGFIKPEDGGGHVFAHVKENPALRDCRRGDPVTYDAEYDRFKGKYLAVNVRARVAHAPGRLTGRFPPSASGAPAGSRSCADRRPAEPSGRSREPSPRRSTTRDPSVGGCDDTGTRRGGPALPEDVAPAVARAADELGTEANASLLSEVERARASGLNRAFDGQWVCPTGEVVLVLGSQVADKVGRLDWALRPYWPGTVSRRLRATVEGVELSGRLSWDGCELRRSDGDIWRRLLPEGHRPAGRPEPVPADCIVAAYERSLIRAPAQDSRCETDQRQRGLTLLPNAAAGKAGNIAGNERAPEDTRGGGQGSGRATLARADSPSAAG